MPPWLEFMTTFRVAIMLRLAVFGVLVHKAKIDFSRSVCKTYSTWLVSHGREPRIVKYQTALINCIWASVQPAVYDTCSFDRYWYTIRSAGLSWPALALVPWSVLDQECVLVPLVSCLVTSLAGVPHGLTGWTLPLDLPRPPPWG